MVRAYTSFGRGLTTQQFLAIPGREAEMVPNNAGGFGFKLDHWERLERFLILSSENGTYYVGQQQLTAQNAQSTIACIQEDGVRVVELARDISVQNRSPKTDQLLFTLALAMKHGDLHTKNAVRLAAPSMLRTGTHLLHFAAMLDSLGGWSRSKRRLLRNWMRSNPIETIAYQALKYRARDGWAMRDLLRVSHPRAPSIEHASVYDWICGRQGMAEHWPTILMDHTMMCRQVDELGVAAVLHAIDRRIPREAVPTEFLGEVAVQRALIGSAGLHQLLRNLGAWTASGALEDDGEDTQTVALRLCSLEALQRARVHPFAVLLASLVYGQGQGFRSTKTWRPLKEIVEALDQAYELTWNWQTPTKKRMLVAIDISGSMSMDCVGTPIPARLAAAAVALTLTRHEPYATVVEADTGVRRIVGITRRTGISNLQGTQGGGTDLTAAVRWAIDRGEDFDVIVILTDNETWAGKEHPTQAWATYKAKIHPDAKLIVAAMASNHANIVDPLDSSQLGIAGLDANLPAVIAQFIG